MEINKLDEMQLQIKNKIGTQSFFLLCCLLTIDVILYGLGIMWLEYPIDIFFIMILCLMYYSVRLLLQGAYIRTTTNKSQEVVKKVLSSIISVVISSLIAVITIKVKFIKITGTTKQNNDAKFLIISLVVMLIILVVLMIVSNKRYQKDDE